jgi:quercetin dioxygenase-like cupin family protein
MSLYDLNTMEPEEVTPAYVRTVAVAETMALARIEVRRGAVTMSHTHANEEVVLVLTGAWRFSLPSGDVELGANQMLVIPPGVEHSSEALEDTVALDICTPARTDWVTGEDRHLHDDPDQFLWAV